MTNPVIGDTAADLARFEPVQPRNVVDAQAIPAWIAAFIPSGDIPTISGTPYT